MHQGAVHELWNTGNSGSGGRATNNSNRFTEALQQGLSDSSLQKLAAGVGLSPQDQQRLQQLQRLAGMGADAHPGQYRSQQQQAYGNSATDHQPGRSPQQQQQQPHAMLQEALVAAASGNGSAASTALFSLLTSQGNSGSGSLYNEASPAPPRQQQTMQAAVPPSTSSGNSGTDFAALLQQLGVNNSNRGENPGASDDLFNLLKSLTQQGGGHQHGSGAGTQPMPNGNSSWGSGGGGPLVQPPGGGQRDGNPLSQQELLQQALAQFASNSGFQ